MVEVLRRFGFRISRGLTLVLLLVGAGVVAAFWIGPLKPVPAELTLLALGRDGRFGTSVELRSALRDSAAAPSARDGRYPLLLAIRNRGAQASAPAVLSLSIPARFRLVNGTGTPYPPDRAPNNPLLRYRLRLPEPRTAFEPDSLPQPLARMDTLWLEPVLHEYQCILSANGVPEFVPAPTYDAAELARFAVYWALIGDSPGVRQTGLLDLHVDPERLRRPQAPPLPNSSPTVAEPSLPMPELGTLAAVGTRETECGEPMQPVEVQTFAWRTTEGGLFLVLYQGGAPRKYLFDLNVDSVAELEMWDPDGDGDFEASRPTRLPLPSYLLPVTRATIAVDTVPTDSAWLANFRAVADGPFRFLPDSLRPDRRPPPADTVPPPAATAPPTTPPAAQQRRVPARADTTPARRDTFAPPPPRRDTLQRRDTLTPPRRDTLTPPRRDTLTPPRRDTLTPPRRDTLVRRGTLVRRDTTILERRTS
jgi:hypothetical protein